MLQTRVLRRCALGLGWLALLVAPLSACQNPPKAGAVDDPSSSEQTAAADPPARSEPKEDDGGLFGLFKKPKGKAEGEPWGIRVAAFRDALRGEQAENCAEQLRHASGIDARLVKLFHDREESSVFYGVYSRTYDTTTNAESFKPDPRNDLDLIRSMSMEVVDAQGNPHSIWPFQFATVAALPDARRDTPAVNESWNLANAEGYYSLQIAVFYNTDDMQQRKQGAEEYCKLLRSEGEEAYYHHGPSSSSVFVGSFPESAIQDASETDPMSGAVHVRRKIVDPEMLRLQERYPHNLHNGHIAYDLIKDPKTGQKVRDPHVSFAVKIPRDDEGDWPASFGGRQ